LCFGINRFRQEKETAEWIFILLSIAFQKDEFKKSGHAKHIRFVGGSGFIESNNRGRILANPPSS